MFPPGEWVFAAEATDASSGNQYALRYKLNSGSLPSIIFNSRTLTGGGSYYPVTPATFVLWGGESWDGPCNCDMQFVRFFRDYAPTSMPEMLNLAFLSLNGNFKKRTLTVFKYFKRKCTCILFYERSEIR